MGDLEEKECLIGQANNERPGVGNLFALPSTRMVSLGKGQVGFVTRDLDFTDHETMAASFLRVHPEWALDVKRTESGDTLFSLPAALALSKFLGRFGIGDPEKASALQHQLTDQIIDSGGDFRPMSQRT
jgi:hypothetical protein